ncbi:MAG: hypothetical protein QOH65_3261 [Methylobacteriaceae bacterium]|jgi:hypothetical protein|nr:hypothetical protein [Methylobacteriaceae bacterium]
MDGFRSSTLMYFAILVTPAVAGDHAWHCMTPEQVATHEVHGDNLVLGKINITQREGQLADVPVIHITFVANNHGSKDFHVVMEVLGSSEMGPVFAMSVEPAFAGTVSPHREQPATSAIFAQPGELSRVTKVCIKFEGDF